MTERRRTGFPIHVGLIPDGTRRWACIHRVPLADAYTQAMHKVAAFVNLFFEHGVQAVSVYLCSVDNLTRPSNELDQLFDAESALCRSHLLPIVDKHHSTVHAVGRVELLPRNMGDALADLVRNTSSYSRTRLYLCAAYDPVAEVAQAVARAPRPELLMKHLQVPEPLDIVFRSSGMPLFSNFLPLQCGYARLMVLHDLFNDVTAGDLLSRLNSFAKDTRRFGE